LLLQKSTCIFFPPFHTLFSEELYIFIISEIKILYDEVNQQRYVLKVAGMNGNGSSPTAQHLSSPPNSPGASSNRNESPAPTVASNSVASDANARRNSPGEPCSVITSRRRHLRTITTAGLITEGDPGDQSGDMDDEGMAQPMQHVITSPYGPAKTSPSDEEGHGDSADGRRTPVSSNLNYAIHHLNLLTFTSPNITTDDRILSTRQRFPHQGTSFIGVILLT